MSYECVSNIFILQYIAREFAKRDDKQWTYFFSHHAIIG